ncbi:MAG: MFS transporter, partial [Eubacterium sp.]
KKCMKDPSVWVIAFMVMGCYALTTTLNGYASKIATIGFGTSATMAAVIGMFNQYFKPFGAIGGGFLSDRVGASKTLFVAIGALIIGTLAIAFMPKSSATLVLFLVIFAITIVFVGIARGQFYAPMQEAKIPLNLTGTATGLIATIAYTPDIFLPPISGKILDTFEGAQALQYILLMLAAFGLFALIMCVIFIKINKKNIEELQQEKKERRL